LIALALASYLASQTWAWSPVPGATSYRLYFSAGMTTWCQQDRIEFPASVCDAVDCQGEIPEPQFSPAFILVTAVDSSGNESGTDHGEVQPCP